MSAADEPSTLTFQLNGRETTVDVRADESMLETLRERCGITSTKNGCEPQGQCGCCLALVDGKPKVTCAMKSCKAAGKSVETLEGLSTEDRDLVARAFVAAAGLQCGFCIPGLAMRATSLLAKNPNPTREEIAKSIDVHLCRCTGYKKVVDAVELMAKAKRGEGWPEPIEDGGVGSNLARYRGLDLVLGERDYTDDLRFEGMVHGVVVLSEHPRALVRRIDTSDAAAVDGVVRILTAEDVPGNRWNGLIYPDWPGFVAVGEEVRCVGDVVAVVGAEDAATARRAAGLINVDYELLDPVLTPQASIAPGAPRVNPVKPNILATTAFKRGDVDKALASSAHVVTEHFQTQRLSLIHI